MTAGTSGKNLDLTREELDLILPKHMWFWISKIYTLVMYTDQVYLSAIRAERILVAA